MTQPGCHIRQNGPNEKINKDKYQAVPSDVSEKLLQVSVTWLTTVS